jgi:hypothetical protein
MANRQRRDTRSETSSSGKLSTDKREELRLARRCFDAIERLVSSSSGYPPGHPVVEEALDNVQDAFYSFFNMNDRLAIRIASHEAYLLGTDQIIWETSRPDDYCMALDRDGVYLLYFMAGIHRRELRQFVSVLEQLVSHTRVDNEGEEETDEATEDDESGRIDAASALVDANFDYIDFEALDASLAWLGGLDVEVGGRDTAREERAIRKLYDRVFDAYPELGEDGSERTGDTLDAKLDLDVDTHAETQRRIESGSDHLLNLKPAHQQHLDDLKHHLLRGEQLEERYGEGLASILASERASSTLQERAFDRVANILSRLLESDQPWESLSFLKTLHRWRDDFDDEVTTRLRTIVEDRMAGERLDQLVERIASEERDVRQSILHLFHALDLEEASGQLVGLLEFELEEDVQSDIFEYLDRRARKSGLNFIGDRLESLPDTIIDRIVEIGIEHVPNTRVFLLDILRLQVDPDVKMRVLEALQGQWDDPREIRTYVIPLLNHLNSDLRLLAIESIAEGAPQHVRRVLGSKLDQDLTDLPEEELETLVTTFARHGGGKAAEKLESLIRQHKFASQEQKETAETIARALLQAPTSPVVEMLQSVADDWKVSGNVREACREVVDVIG